MTGRTPDDNPPLTLQVNIATQLAAATSAHVIRDGFSSRTRSILTFSTAVLWPLSGRIVVRRHNRTSGTSTFSIRCPGIRSRRWLTSDRTRFTSGRRRDINQPAPGPGANNPRRQFPRFSDILMTVPLGGANYQGLEAKFERRFSGDSRSCAATRLARRSKRQIGQRTSRSCAGKRLSFQHLPHRFFTAAVWDLPFGSRPPVASSRPRSQIVGGWQISPIFEVQRGLPVHSRRQREPGQHYGHLRPDRFRDGNFPLGAVARSLV